MCVPFGFMWIFLSVPWSKKREKNWTVGLYKIKIKTKNSPNVCERSSSEKGLNLEAHDFIGWQGPLKIHGTLIEWCKMSLLKFTTIV